MIVSTRWIHHCGAVLLFCSSVGRVQGFDKIYSATNNVEEFLKLGLDIRDMRLTDDMDEKREIYTNGRNSAGQSLSALSLQADTQYATHFMFNLYRFAFQQIGVVKEDDDLGYFDGEPIAHYADTLVNDLFSLELSRIEAEGALVYNVLMAYWAKLTDLMDACKAATTDNNHKPEMSLALDQAAAYWIGQDQLPGDAQSGYMFYSLAELAGSRFGQKQDGITAVNTRVMETFGLIKESIDGNFCATTSPTGQAYREMRERVQHLISLSNVVMVQMLLYRIDETSNTASMSDHVELFALSVLPQVYSCDLGVFETVFSLTVSQDVTPSTQTDAIAAVQAMYSCLHITCQDVGTYQGGKIPQCSDDGQESLAGYVPQTHVQSVANIDRDIKWVSVLMDFDAFDAARDFYVYGWHGDFHRNATLHDLAMNNYSPTTSAEFELFSSYYQYQDYRFADEAMMKLFKGDIPFNTMTTFQRYAIGRSLMRAVIMYLAVTGELDSAVAACHGGADADQVHHHWDSAAAFFIGSAEGSNAGGQEGGECLFGLTKEFCTPFEKCEPSTSVVGEQLVIEFNKGTEMLSQKKCDEVATLVTNKIKPTLLIPLIQGDVFYTDAIAEGTADRIGQYGAAMYGFSEAILPAFHEASDASATTIIQNRDVLFSVMPVQATTLYDAIRTGLENMLTNCSDVGRIATNGVSYGFCAGDTTVAAPTAPAPQGTTAPTRPPTPAVWTPPPAPVYVPEEEHPNGLAWDDYTFTDPTAANNQAAFSMDIKGMFNSPTPENALTIYNKTGTYAMPALMNGASVKNLAAMSTQSSLFMLEDPMYNFFRSALYQDPTFDLDDPNEKWDFSDEVVRLAIKNGESAQLASEATVVMNVWMFITHRLYESMRRCEDQEDGRELIDSAVALYIGQEQGKGKFNSGWMLYSIAQSVLQDYGMPEAESVTNTNVLTYLGELQDMARNCNGDMSHLYQFRLRVFEAIREMSKPLLHKLLFHMSEDTTVDDFKLTELYALAFVPQAISVDIAAFGRLKDALFQEFDRNTALTDELVADLARVLHGLRYSCLDLGDTTNANENLKSLVSAICSKMHAYENSMLAAFEISSREPMELARVDLDIHQIDLFMRVEAYEAAADMYALGWNSIGPQGVPVSLRAMGMSQDRAAIGEAFDLYRAYFDTENYADEIIVAAMEGTGQYASASRLQRAESVTRTFQTMVTYMEMVAKLYLAADACETQGGGQVRADEALALFVGSKEGPYSGGDADHEGRMMFALAKEFCKHFDRCESHGDSASNEKIMFAFSDLKEAIDNGECDTVRTTVIKTIMELLPVSLIQGTLSLVTTNEDLLAQSPNATLAAADVVAKAVLPLVYAVNHTEAAVIGDNTEFNHEVKAVKNGTKPVFNAFASVMRGIGVDCNDVGTMASSGYSTCSPNFAPEPDTPTNLGDNLYVTTTYVQDRANIALDVEAMASYLEVNNDEGAKLVYERGQNSPIYNVHGQREDLRALGRFSTEAAVKMTQNPLYQVSVYALKDGNGQYLGKPATQFADTIVREALANDGKEKVAAEAAVALNLWMELANELFQTVDNCRKKTIADTDGVHSIDEAVAYWIGDGQIAGDAQNGHLLYALAEQMGQQFGLDATGQSRTNTNILRYFQEAKLELSMPDSCSDNLATPRRLRRIVDKIVSQMIAVNIQGLIHNLRQDDRARVRVYAHSFVPLVAACEPSTFSYLRANLLDKSYNEVAVDAIIERIRSTLPCFELRCADIGVHLTETDSICSDPADPTPLAGYRPATSVAEYSRIDLDILELDILLKMEAYEAALELYEFGKHASQGDSDHTALSLGFLATTSGRSAVPELDAFTRYFGEDKNYADKLIRDAMNVSGGNSMSATERRVRVIFASQYMVMYMAALQAMQEAVQACSSSSGPGGIAAENWDKAAAFMIGHLEGTSSSGSNAGRLTWGLSKTYCDEFDTCSNEIEDSTHNNDVITTLLYSGRGALLSGNCGEIRKAAKELEPMLLTPIIQASLSAAVGLNGNNADHTLKIEGYMYTESILPLIEDVNRNAAATIKSQFSMSNTMNSAGVGEVVSAFSKSYKGLRVDCDDLGESEEINPCTGSVQSSGNKTGIVLASLLCLAAVAALLFVQRRRKQKKKVEDSPTFVKSSGVLNHTSDVLPSEAELGQTDELIVTATDTGSSRSSRGDAETDLLKGTDADASLEDDDDEYLAAIANSKNADAVENDDDGQERIV